MTEVTYFSRHTSEHITGKPEALVQAALRGDLAADEVMTALTHEYMSRSGETDFAKASIAVGKQHPILLEKWAKRDALKLRGGE